MVGAGSFEIVGPDGDVKAVRAWSDSYVPFEPQSNAEMALRAAVRERLPTLVAGDGEVLSARYAGPKPAGTDIENVVFHIVAPGRMFQPSAVAGLRFEYDRGAVPPAPSGRAWSSFFEYSLAPREKELACWR